MDSTEIKRPIYTLYSDSNDVFKAMEIPQEIFYEIGEYNAKKEKDLQIEDKTYSIEEKI